MSFLQWLGLTIFVFLLYKCAAPFKQKLTKLRNKQEGAIIDFIFMMTAIIMCIWAIVAIFSFPH